MKTIIKCLILAAVVAGTSGLQANLIDPKTMEKINTWFNKITTATWYDNTIERLEAMKDKALKAQGACKSKYLELANNNKSDYISLEMTNQLQALDNDGKVLQNRWIEINNTVNAVKKHQQKYPDSFHSKASQTDIKAGAMGIGAFVGCWFGIQPKLIWKPSKARKLWHWNERPQAQGGSGWTVIDSIKPGRWKSVHRFSPSQLMLIALGGALVGLLAVELYQESLFNSLSCISEDSESVSLYNKVLKRHGEVKTENTYSQNNNQDLNSNKDLEN